METSHRSRSTGSASLPAASKSGAPRERTVDSGAPPDEQLRRVDRALRNRPARPVESLGVFGEYLEAFRGRHLGDDCPAPIENLAAHPLAVTVAPAEGGGHRQGGQDEQDDDADRQQITHAGALCYQSRTVPGSLPRALPAPAGKG